MAKGHKVDFQRIRRKTQIKDSASFRIYLKNIFDDLAKKEKICSKEDTNTKILRKLTFIQYMKVPFILGEKIFNSIDKNKKGYLLQGEFIDSISNLYVGDLEEVQKIIFRILDFDGDGKIIPEDSRLLISFIKNIGSSITNVIKLKTKIKKESNDEENLTEINDLISTFFDNKENMTFE